MSFPSINIAGYGSVYVGTTTLANVYVHNNGFTLAGGGRAYFLNSNHKIGIGSPNIYWKTPLLGKTFSYDVDMSSVPCGCNAAAYFVDMPGINSTGAYVPTSGQDYYCDASKVQGTYCPEYDMMEGNKYTIASTLHSCAQGSPSGYFPTCDGNGCQTNAYNVMKTLMCPGISCTINTNKKFRITHTLHSVSNKLNYVNVALSQGSQSANFNICANQSYVSSMTNTLKNGMTFVSSLWGGSGMSMSWLDGVTGCTENCNLALANVTFSNFSYYDISASPTSTPTIIPTSYKPSIKPTLSPTFRPSISSAPNPPTVAPSMNHRIILSTNKNQIVNSHGFNVRIAGVTWFGFEGTGYVAGGLGTANYKSILDSVNNAGFNTIRIPFSNVMLSYRQILLPQLYINYDINPDLYQLYPLQILDKIFLYCSQIGLKIILDNHWFNPGGSQAEQRDQLWYIPSDKVWNETRWISDWVSLAKRYAPGTVYQGVLIGADLRNELQGSATWGNTSRLTDWNKAAERCGNAILSVNPDILIIVQGIKTYKSNTYWPGGNLMGAKTFPITLSVKNKVVYSPHDYPESYALQVWFFNSSYPLNLKYQWNQYWGYLYQQGIAPLMLGQFGSTCQATKDLQWIKSLMSYVNGDFKLNGVSTVVAPFKGISWTYAGLNPDTNLIGGVLEYDWISLHNLSYSYLTHSLDKFIQDSISNTGYPSAVPTINPTVSLQPTVKPSAVPHIKPTSSPSTYSPTVTPSLYNKTRVSTPFVLSTSGNQIVNSHGFPVRLTGINWFGFETSTLVVHGLWARNYKDILNEVKQLGFNTLRIPFSNTMLSSKAPPVLYIDYDSNPDLFGLYPLQILDKIIIYCGELGLKIFLDDHSFIPDNYNNEQLWYIPGDDVWTEERWISDWVMLAERYGPETMYEYVVVGADLKNEPKGIATWGNMTNTTDWNMAATRCGNAILSVNSHWLIIVQGVEEYNNMYYWFGGNLMGVKKYPITLNVPNKIVYSLHDYPESVADQSWFFNSQYPYNLPDVWTQYWGYIYKQKIAPVIVGEFGSLLQTVKDQKWMRTLVAYMNGDFELSGVSNVTESMKAISWTMWCLNPESGDTGGLLYTGYQYVDRYKYSYIKPALDNIMQDSVANTQSPTIFSYPSLEPTFSLKPSPQPSRTPTFFPTIKPSKDPTAMPSTGTPTGKPSTAAPSHAPNFAATLSLRMESIVSSVGTGVIMGVLLGSLDYVLTIVGIL